MVSHESEGEKRNDFRAYFVPPLAGEASLLSIDDKKILTKKIFKAFILDLSAGGVRIRTNVNLSVIKKILIKISFELEGEVFDLTGKIIRKENPKKDTFEYGLKFIDLLYKDEHRLVKSLNMYQTKKVRSEQEQLKIRKKTAEETVFIDLLEIVPYPALLVSYDRNIIAQNKKGDKLCKDGSLKCFNRLFQTNTPCDHCRLEELEEKKGELSVGEVFINNKKYKANWFDLKERLFIHYFIPEQSCPELTEKIKRKLGEYGIVDPHLNSELNQLITDYINTDYENNNDVN